MYPVPPRRPWSKIVCSDRRTGHRTVRLRDDAIDEVGARQVQPVARDRLADVGQERFAFCTQRALDLGESRGISGRGHAETVAPARRPHARREGSAARAPNPAGRGLHVACRAPTPHRRDAGARARRRGGGATRRARAHDGPVPRRLPRARRREADRRARLGRRADVQARCLRGRHHLAGEGREERRDAPLPHPRRDVRPQLEAIPATPTASTPRGT